MSERTVIADITVSMDGFTADPNGGMGWLLETALHEQTRAAFEGVWRGASTVLLGRNNYEGFQAYWPPVASDPGSDPRDQDFATWLDEVEKVVFSRTLTTASWANSRVAADLETEVRALKRAPGRDIVVFSSVSIIQALLRSDLLDEIRTYLVPAVLGGGRRLFPEGMPSSTWQLTGLTTIPTGALILQHRRT